jgi:16S rRNA (cytosine967-C5)-methyltransferase
MNYAQQYVSSAGTICKQYDGSVPLAVFLKQYFAANKKFGSRDRKSVSHLCYCFYRLGHAAPDLAFEERIRLALFLCEEEPGLWSVLFTGEWLEQWKVSLDDRISFAVSHTASLNPAQIFPWHEQLDKGYDPLAFSCSHLVQPDLFLRIRPENHKAVIKKLEAAGISFQQIGEDCIALPNQTKLEQLLVLDKEVVVQDKSSQQIGTFMRRVKDEIITVWDCCAASGGKSILLHDIQPKAKLTVSDIRESIIRNLQKRFAQAGIRAEKIMIADLSRPYTNTSLQSFDLIICDAPCTGSGTWGRTPEQLHFFKPEKIDHYSNIQRSMVKTLVPHIKTGGYLLYSTCSVFSKENEAVVKTLPANMELIEMAAIRGYREKADSMFAALLRKTS